MQLVWMYFTVSGENADEQPRWQEVLKEQLTVGLEGVDKSKVTIAYEPVWAIGPGKIPPDADYIRKIASYVKEVTDGMDVVYGGGLKTDNAKMLASVKEIDGGLIALTRFSGRDWIFIRMNIWRSLRLISDINSQYISFTDRI